MKLITSNLTIDGWMDNRRDEMKGSNGGTHRKIHQ